MNLLREEMCKYHGHQLLKEAQCRRRQRLREKGQCMLSKGRAAVEQGLCVVKGETKTCQTLLADADTLPQAQ